MLESKSSHRYSAELLLILVVTIWGSNYPLAKYAIAGLNPLVFNGIRYIVAAAIIMLLFFARSSWKTIERNDLSKVIVTGLVGGVVYQMAFIIGLGLTTAGNSAVLLSTSPLWTIFFNARLHKEKILPKTLFGMIISLCGVVMIIIGSGKQLEFGSNALLGDLISLAAAALRALNTNLQKPLLAKYSTTQVTLLLIGIGAIGLSVIAIPSAVSVSWSSLHWSYVAAAVVSGLLSIGIANLLWSYGVKRLGPGNTSNFSNLVPIIAFSISYFTLHEEILMIQIAGAAVTIVGVWVARK